MQNGRRPVEEYVFLKVVKLLIVSLSLSLLSLAAEKTPVELARNVAEQGSALVTERDNYTYRQSFKFFEIKDGMLAGRYEEVRDITFTSSGERDEKLLKKPVSQLKRMRLTPEDFADLRNINPFVLTNESLRFYKVTYKGTETVDSITCHVLHIKPRQILYGQRFFEGLLWVGIKHGQVIRISGQPVPQMHRIKNSNLFPRFTTYYEPIDGKYWFPVRTLADDILPFPSGNQRVKLIIEYSEYQRFTANSTITFGETSKQ